MEHKMIDYEIAKELALKAIEENLLRVVPVEGENAETAGKKVADFFNAILDNLKL